MLRARLLPYSFRVHPRGQGLRFIGVWVALQAALHLAIPLIPPQAPRLEAGRLGRSYPAGTP